MVEEMHAGQQALPCPAVVDAVDHRRSVECTARHPLRAFCRHVALGMETLSKVATGGEEGTFMGSSDDRSGFHNLGVQLVS